jgi:hypothetical protein
MSLSVHPSPRLNRQLAMKEPSKLAQAITCEFIACPARDGKLSHLGTRMAHIVDAHLENLLKVATLGSDIEHAQENIKHATPTP